jgi:2-dehydro-3-deoxyphosphogluconate aldolase / (4S)-4-hydroxy-2-oxoglutarate aldolase
MNYPEDHQKGIKKILLSNPVIPVVTINKVEEVIPLAEFLLTKDISVIEITLRTSCAFEAIEKLAKSSLNITVGAGTVINSKLYTEAVNRGVDFVVSPGWSEDIHKAFLNHNAAFLPGVATPSEIISVKQHDLNYLKFFPANINGGTPALKAYQAVFPNTCFCPTGGISKSNYKDYLALESVLAVGGSWVHQDWLSEIAVY